MTYPMYAAKMVFDNPLRIIKIRSHSHLRHFGSLPASSKVGSNVSARNVGSSEVRHEKKEIVDSDLYHLFVLVGCEDRHG